MLLFIYGIVPNQAAESLDIPDIQTRSLFVFLLFMALCIFYLFSSV